jgi:hypothetical protein
MLNRRKRRREENQSHCSLPKRLLAVKSLVDIFSPLAQLPKNVALLLFVQSLFCLIKLVLGGNATKWLKIGRILLASYASTQIHFVATHDMAALVFQLVLLGQSITQQSQSHFGGGSRKENMMLGGNPNKAELVFKQNQLALDKPIILKSLARNLPTSRVSVKLSVALFAYELDWRQGRRVARGQISRKRSFTSWDVAIASDLACVNSILRIGYIDHLRTMFSIAGGEDKQKRDEANCQKNINRTQFATRMEIEAYELTHFPTQRPSRLNCGRQCRADAATSAHFSISASFSSLEASFIFFA